MKKFLFLLAMIMFASPAVAVPDAANNPLPSINVQGSGVTVTVETAHNLKIGLPNYATSNEAGKDLLKQIARFDPMVTLGNSLNKEAQMLREEFCLKAHAPQNSEEYADRFTDFAVRYMAFVIDFEDANVRLHHAVAEVKRLGGLNDPNKAAKALVLGSVGDAKEVPVYVRAYTTWVGSNDSVLAEFAAFETDLSVNHLIEEVRKERH